jgi:hypothetical protein
MQYVRDNNKNPKLQMVAFKILGFYWAMQLAYLLFASSHSMKTNNLRCSILLSF